MRFILPDMLCAEVVHYRSETSEPLDMLLFEPIRIHIRMRLFFLWMLALIL